MRDFLTDCLAFVWGALCAMPDVWCPPGASRALWFRGNKGRARELDADRVHPRATRLALTLGVAGGARRGST